MTVITHEWWILAWYLCLLWLFTNRNVDLTKFNQLNIVGFGTGNWGTSQSTEKYLNWLVVYLPLWKNTNQLTMFMATWGGIPHVSIISRRWFCHVGMDVDGRTMQRPCHWRSIPGNPGYKVPPRGPSWTYKTLGAPLLIMTILVIAEMEGWSWHPKYMQIYGQIWSIDVNWVNSGTRKST